MCIRDSNESTCLIEAIERFKERTGYYPERVLADRIYRTRDVYKRQLSDEDRDYLKALSKKRTIQAQVVDRARILLYKADGMTFQMCIRDSCDCCMAEPARI